MFVFLLTTHSLGEVAESETELFVVAVIPSVRSQKHSNAPLYMLRALERKARYLHSLKLSRGPDILLLNTSGKQSGSVAHHLFSCRL